MLEINLRLTLVLIKGAAIVRIKCGEPSWGNIGGEHFHVRNAVRQFGDAVGGGNRRESACSEAVKCCLGTFISLQWLCLLFLIYFFQVRHRASRWHSFRVSRLSTPCLCPLYVRDVLHFVCIILHNLTSQAIAADEWLVRGCVRYDVALGPVAAPGLACGIGMAVTIGHERNTTMTMDTSVNSCHDYVPGGFLLLFIMPQIRS